MSMNESWVAPFISCMMVGNHVYDTHIFTPTYLSVEEAVPLVRKSLGDISNEQELIVQYNLYFNM